MHTLDDMDGYTLYTDPQTGHPYYYNSVTGDSKWAEDVDAAGVAVESDDRADDERVANAESDEGDEDSDDDEDEDEAEDDDDDDDNEDDESYEESSLSDGDDGEDDSEMEAHEEAHFKAMLASPEGQRTLEREMETVGRHEQRREHRQQSKTRASRRAEDDDDSATESDNSDDDPESGARKRNRGRRRRRAANQDNGWLGVALYWTRRLLFRGASNAKYAGAYAGVFISEVARLVWQEEGQVDSDTLADARVPLTGDAAPDPSPAAPAIANPIAGSL